MNRHEHLDKTLHSNGMIENILNIGRDDEDDTNKAVCKLIIMS